MSVTKDAPVGALAGLSALPKNTLENFAKWGAALVRQPLVRTRPLLPSAFPSAFVFLCLAVVTAPTLPRITRGVLAALAVQ